MQDVRVAAIASLTPLEELDSDPSWWTPAASTPCAPDGRPAGDTWSSGSCCSTGCRRTTGCSGPTSTRGRRCLRRPQRAGAGTGRDLRAGVLGGVRAARGAPGDGRLEEPRVRRGDEGAGPPAAVDAHCRVRRLLNPAPRAPHPEPLADLPHRPRLTGPALPTRPADPPHRPRLGARPGLPPCPARSPCRADLPARGRTLPPQPVPRWISRWKPGRSSRPGRSSAGSEAEGGPRGRRTRARRALEDGRRRRPAGRRRVGGVHPHPAGPRRHPPRRAAPVRRRRQHHPHGPDRRLGRGRLRPAERARVAARRAGVPARARPGARPAGLLPQRLPAAGRPLADPGRARRGRPDNAVVVAAVMSAVASATSTALAVRDDTAYRRRLYRLAGRSHTRAGDAAARPPARSSCRSTASATTRCGRRWRPAPCPPSPPGPAPPTGSPRGAPTGPARPAPASSRCCTARTTTSPPSAGTRRTPGGSWSATGPPARASCSAAPPPAPATPACSRAVAPAGATSSPEAPTSSPWSCRSRPGAVSAAAHAPATSRTSATPPTPPAPPSPTSPRSAARSSRRSPPGCAATGSRAARGGLYPFVRAFATVVERDVVLAAVMGDVLAGRPAVYADFVAYDEVAHHSGPHSRDALKVLERIDRCVALVARRRARAAPVPDRALSPTTGRASGRRSSPRTGSRCATSSGSAAVCPSLRRVRHSPSGAEARGPCAPPCTGRRRASSAARRASGARCRGRSCWPRATRTDLLPRRAAPDVPRGDRPPLPRAAAHPGRAPRDPEAFACWCAARSTGRWCSAGRLRGARRPQSPTPRRAPRVSARAPPAPSGAPTPSARRDIMVNSMC